jgi:hypothetical protein
MTVGSCYGSAASVSGEQLTMATGLQIYEQWLLYSIIQ